MNRKVFISGDLFEYVLGACEALGEPNPSRLLREALEYYLDHRDWRRNK